MTIVKRIDPYRSYKGPPTPDNPSGWRRADPETDTFPQEEATDTARSLQFPVTGKTVQVVAVFNGKPGLPRIIENCPADLSTVQLRKNGGWQDFYVDEVLP